MKTFASIMLLLTLLCFSFQMHQIVNNPIIVTNFMIAGVTIYSIITAITFLSKE